MRNDFWKTLEDLEEMTFGRTNDEIQVLVEKKKTLNTKSPMEITSEETAEKEFRRLMTMYGPRVEAFASKIPIHRKLKFKRRHRRPCTP